MSIYSEQSLLEALKSHSMNTRRPRVISSDAGSQIKSAARRTTRASVRIAEEFDTKGQVLIQTNEEGNLKSWAQMLNTLKQKFTGDVTWCIAPSSAQSYNGLCEANVRIMKQLLKSHFRILSLENFVFQSFINMQYSFTAVKHLLNNRPVYHSETQVVTCHDLMFPGFTNEDEESGSLRDIVDFTDQAFTHFCRFPDKPSTLAVNDFVMITGASRPKYGIIQEFISKHRLSVRMLLKRSKSGEGPVGNSVVALGNVIHLHIPKKK